MSKPSYQRRLSQIMTQATSEKIVWSPAHSSRGQCQVRNGHRDLTICLEYACSRIEIDRSRIKGDDMETAAEVLFGKTRQAVLTLLFDQPDRMLYLREFARQTGISTGALQRELKQLERAGLVTRKRDGNRVGAKRTSETDEDYFYRLDLPAIHTARLRYSKFLHAGVAVEFCE